MTRRVPYLLAVLVSGCAALSDEPPPDAPGNLLKNGSFEVWAEAGPIGWEVLQQGFNERLELEGSGFHGRHSGTITCSAPDEFIFLRQTVPPTKPGLYRASAYMRSITQIREVRLVVNCLDAGGKRLAVESRDLRGQLGEWRPVVVAVRPPEGTAALRYEIRVGPGATGEVAVDAARLELVSEEKPAEAK